MADDADYADQYNGGALLVTVVFFQVLTWLSVALRTYVRVALTKNFQSDDWLMLVAQANFTLSCAFIAVGLTRGLGRHNTTLPQWEEILAIKWQAIATATYITNMMFIKLSIGVFLLRLATQRRYRWIIWTSMGIVAAMSTALFLWDMFQCKPVAAQWDYTIPGYTCVSPGQVVQAAYALSVLSILSDWLYALLPIAMLWNAKMTPQAKATVSVVLSLGIFASIATLIRVKYLIDLTDADDILYAGTNAMVWTLIEPGVAIVAASLVTIRPLLRQLRLKGFETSERSRSRNFWPRYGRSTGGFSESSGKKLSKGSKRSRAASGMDAFDADNVMLRDIEAGAPVTSDSNATSTKKGFWSRDTTSVSQSSYHDRDLGMKSAARNFSTPLRMAVEEVVEEKKKKRTKKRNNKEDSDSDNDDTSPTSPWMRMGAHASRGESGLVFQQQQQHPVTLRGHVQHGKTMWQTETPNSPEEAEAIQGLRELSSRMSGRSRFS
ncbi:unnamed protein product [Discula destructiva]